MNPTPGQQGENLGEGQESPASAEQPDVTPDKARSTVVDQAKAARDRMRPSVEGAVEPQADADTTDSSSPAKVETGDDSASSSKSTLDQSTIDDLKSKPASFWHGMFAEKRVKISYFLTYII